MICEIGNGGASFAVAESRQTSIFRTPFRVQVANLSRNRLCFWPRSIPEQVPTREDRPRRQACRASTFHLERAALHPAETASASSQKYRSPFSVLIFVRVYQGDHGV